jgi:hypothetical protein
MASFRIGISAEPTEVPKGGTTVFSGTVLWEGEPGSGFIPWEGLVRICSVHPNMPNPIYHTVASTTTDEQGGYSATVTVTERHVYLATLHLGSKRYESDLAVIVEVY